MTTLRTRRLSSPRGWLAGLAATLVLAVAGGCSTGSDSPRTPATSAGAACQPAESARCGPVRAPAPAPAPITPQGARAIIANYVKINNNANEARSRTLNDRIETGAVHAQSQAEFTTYSRWTTQEKTYLKPFSYLQPRFFIPRASASAERPWFAVVARYSNAKNTTSFMVFVKEGSIWKLSAQTGFDAGQTVPPIAVDADGYATSVDQDSTGLAMRPSALPLAVNDNYISGGTGDASVFAKSPDNTYQRKAHNDAKTFLRPYAASEFTAANDPYRDVYALKTTDGGALVIASSVHNQYEHVIVPTGYITLGPHARELAWVHSTSVQALTTTYTCLDAASIPPSGKVNLLGSDCETTGAS